MVQFTSTILQFEKQGEKTGWTYITIPATIAQQLKPGNKKSFRVKGKLDSYSVKGIALLPMGEGDFIMALNAAVRKAIGKRRGAQLRVQLETDNKPLVICPELMECLADEPKAFAAFNKMPKSFQNYYSKWIETAKTEQTKTKRIAMAVSSLSKGMNFGEMLRAQKKDKEDLLG
jgi:Domain of unknown function (DUF1905)/Bacteriocin-protection, YdeI or OmpD-Associated